MLETLFKFLYVLIIECLECFKSLLWIFFTKKLSYFFRYYNITYLTQILLCFPRNNKIRSLQSVLWEIKETRNVSYCFLLVC